MRVLALLWRAPMTLALVGITLCGFAVQVALGGPGDLAVDTRLGTLRPDRIAEHGEYFRLVMPLVLHTGWVHLAVDVAGLLLLGTAVEVLFGRLRLLSYTLLAGLSGTLVAAWLQAGSPSSSMGLSGAVLGLSGLLLGTSVIGAEEARLWIGRLFREGAPRLALAVIFAWAFALILLAPAVDGYELLGGFVAGVLLSGTAPRPSVHPTGPPVVAAWVLVAAVVGGGVWAAWAGDDALETLDLDAARMLRVRASHEEEGMRKAIWLAEMAGHYEQIDPDEGHAALDAQVRDLSDPNTLALLSGLLMTEEHHAASLIALERWVAVEPEGPDALNGLAWQLLIGDEDLREPLRAEELSRASLRAIEDPTSRQGRIRRALFHDTLAEALAQQGRLHEALEHQRLAVQLARERGVRSVISELEGRLVLLEERAPSQP